MATGTKFSDIYNRFLGKITDDMYLELTPEDTMRDLQNLLIDSIPQFEFPRVNLEDYALDTELKPEGTESEEDFVLDYVWRDLSDDYTTNLERVPVQTDPGEPIKYVLVDNSAFINNLTAEEINILACIMKQMWVQRQVTSIEVTRMKYTSADFKMTSQANHLAKLLTLLEESRRDQFHFQRLYGRRIKNDSGLYKSNWKSLNTYSS